MMKLSENLSLQEVIKSPTAIKFDIDNTPSRQEIQNLVYIAEHVFQPLRDHLAVPIYVSSGFRSKALNDRIGGSPTSQHRKGQALDLDAHVFGSTTNAEIFHFIRQYLDFDQLIWEFGTNLEPAWVHVSFVPPGRGHNRKEVLKAYKLDGSTKYAPW